MKKTFDNRFVKVLLWCLPLLLATYGYSILEHVRLPDALFNSISLYMLNNSDTPPNLFVEVARWTAPLMTASGVIVVVAVLRERFVSWLKYLGGESVVVYGAGAEASGILEELGRRGIAGGEGLIRAQRYILLNSEEENFNFYRKYRHALADKMVYLKCGSMEGRISGANVKLFCEEETAARLFWRQSKLYLDAAKKDYRLKLVFTGFGKLEEELLLWGLLDNIFHPDQRIEYHLFGDGARFLAMHPQLAEIGDPLFFYEEPWYQKKELLMEADRIFVCSRPDILKDLLFALPGKKIDMLAESRIGMDFLEEQERFSVFCWQEEAGRLDNIFEETLLERAKRINLRYANLYSGVAETEQNKEEEWKKLDTFTRYSNISAADYHEIRLQLLEEARKEAGNREVDLLPSTSGPSTCGKAAGAHDSYGSLDNLEQMANLEHMRWCRYHYLNNWKYGVPPDGKNKDKTARIHTDLRPYGDLSEEDREKDRENIRILLAVR